MANQYGVYHFIWIRGTTAPLIMTYTQNGVPLEFDDARLRVFSKSALETDPPLFELSLNENPGTGPGTVTKDLVSGKLTFHPTEAMTRALIVSKTARDGTVPDKTKGKNRYEVELRNGAETNVYLMGTIFAIGGLNDDEEIPS